ncbi:MAG: urease accessory protein UreD [Hyphomicrobiaceae bacterium]
MFADGSRSEAGADVARDALASIRAAGGLRVAFGHRDGATRLTDLAESGGYRLRFPTTHARHAEAVQVNTGGGVVGGDSLAFEVAVGAGAHAVFATQSAERVYRSSGLPAALNFRIALASRARLDWLPQETILFSGARLARRFEIDVAADSRLLLVEAVTFGRIASGERLGHGLLDDVWRVRRDGRLIFAEATRLDGDITALLERPALGAGARAAAIMLYVAPDAEDRLHGLRETLLPARGLCGASAWNGMLLVRFLGDTATAVRQDVRDAAAVLSGMPLPRVWQG